MNIAVDLGRKATKQTNKQNTRTFPTTGYARVQLFMFLKRELGGTGTGCLFQFIYCVYYSIKKLVQKI